ncbi:MAG: cysteine desulfurase family protein [Rickettsiales bacterium]
MPVYLDYNATSPIFPKALEKMREILPLATNASAIHSFGREARKIMEDSRRVLAEYISVWPNEIVFMASGTEANTTALRAFPDRKLLVSAIEHSSIIKNNDNLRGSYIPVTREGVIDITTLDNLLSQQTQPVLVSVMLANNETGIIQPVKEISDICKKYDALLHCDAVQAMGKIPVDFSLLGVDMLTISAHKCGGALGAAALVVKNDLVIKPLIIGGGQELWRRAGTENIPAIASFAAAIEQFDFKRVEVLGGWLRNMEDSIKKNNGIIIGEEQQRLYNTSCIIMPKVESEVQLMDFDLNGYAVSAGSACSSGRIGESHVLKAMSVPNELAKCAIRVSIGWNSKEEELKDFTKVWINLANRLSS